MHLLRTQLRLLLATDLSERSDRAFDRALMLARDNRAHLIVLHVIDEAFPDRITRHLSKQAHNFIREQVSVAKIRGQAVVEIRIVRGRDYKTIIDQARDGRVHAIVLGTHRTDALIDAFVGATMDRLLRYGAHPMLVVKSKPRSAYGNILVGTDFSTASLQALELALRLFPRARFTLLHVQGKPVAKSLTRRHAALIKLAKSTSERVGDELESPEFTISPALEEGDPVLAMTRRIESKRHDLVVVGTHGRSGWKKALLGSVTQTVLARSRCDVLAVRPALET